MQQSIGAKFAQTRTPDSRSTDFTGRYRRSKLRAQFVSGNHEQIEIEYWRTADRVEALKPGAHRLLLIMHQTFEGKDFHHINRPEIAAALKHSKLHHHDLKLLNQLIAAGLIKARRFALSQTDNEMPRGFEYRYAMNIETAWLISQIESKSPYAFKPERKHEPTPYQKMQQERERAERLKVERASKPQQQSEPVKRDWETEPPWYLKPVEWLFSFIEGTWVERLLDWITG